MLKCKNLTEGRARSMIFIMKSTLKVLAWLMVVLALFGLESRATAQTNTNAAPKRLLVVSVTKGYRHSSIATGLTVVAELAEKSGRFTLDFAGTDAELAAKMTPAALSNYDGVMFLSTTGNLPLPDKAAFLDWIKAGGGFIGVHSATDTFHSRGGVVDPYIDMIGGEFVSHIVTNVDCINNDTNHPATRDLGATWALRDEIYSQKNFSRERVHMLLSLDKNPVTGQPAFVPISWCKNYGNGKVFYTALGHFDEVWDDPVFQQHLLGGILWSLGLEPGDATPQMQTRD